MKVLVTGAAGFIGSHLSRELSGHEIVGLDLKDGIHGDAFYAEIVPDVEVVYHLAAQTSVARSSANPILDARANILLTLRLLEIYPSARFIYTASGGASEQERIASPYGISKKVAGDYIKLLHRDYVICNLSNVFGVGGAGVLERFLREDPITIYGDGNQTRDFVHVSDIVRGLKDAIRWPSGEYFMGSGAPITVNEIADKFGKTVNREPAKAEELYHSNVPNMAPGWVPRVTIDEYLESEGRT